MTTIIDRLLSLKSFLIITITLIFISSTNKKTGELKEKECWMIYENCFSSDFDFCQYGSIHKQPAFLIFDNSKDLSSLYSKEIFFVPESGSVIDSISKYYLINKKTWNYISKLDSLVSISEKVYYENINIKKYLKRKNKQFNKFVFSKMKMKFKYLESNEKEVFLPNFTFTKQQRLLVKRKLKVNYIIAIDTILIR